MSHDDNIEVDWHDVKEEGGVKYTDCEWDSPAPSPRAMQELAVRLQKALADPVKLQKLADLLDEPTEKKVITDTLPHPRLQPKYQQRCQSLLQPVRAQCDW